MLNNVIIIVFFRLMPNKGSSPRKIIDTPTMIICDCLFIDSLVSHCMHDIVGLNLVSFTSFKASMLFLQLGHLAIIL
jgi:hypothetical protein